MLPVPQPLLVVHRGHSHSWLCIQRGSVLILVHTFLQVSTEECRVRIISARKAPKREIKQYEET